MGGVGTPPEMRSRASEPTGRRQCHRVPPAAAAAQSRSGRAATDAKPRLPVALIFVCLVVVYVGIRYYWR